MTGYRWARNAIMTMIGLVVVTGCDSEAARVVVEYKQVANFQEYRFTEDASSNYGAGPDGMFIMYKIKQIKNTGSAATNFVFDVDKVSTLKDQLANATVANSPILLTNLDVKTITVNAGQTKSVNGCFIKKALTPNPDSLVSAQVPVIYGADGGQPVSMDNLAPNGSVAVVSNTLPTALWTLCSSS